MRIDLDTGVATLHDSPITPGDDYYRFRRVLGEHAQRFVTEHNPATLRYDEHDEDHHRIEHVAHELTDENRQKAGNVSLHVRDYIGWLWREIDDFVRLPALPGARIVARPP